MVVLNPPYVSIRSRFPFHSYCLLIVTILGLWCKFVPLSPIHFSLFLVRSQPTLQPIFKPTELGTSASDFYTTLHVEGFKTADALRSGGSSWIDVRDLGEAHARALTKEGAGGNRIIIHAGAFVWQEWRK